VIGNIEFLIGMYLKNNSEYEKAAIPGFFLAGDLPAWYRS
jgi:hypothetical protein